jgi:hypothetical protein
LNVSYVAGHEEANILFHRAVSVLSQLIILKHVDPLLGNDRETSKYNSAFAE